MATDDPLGLVGTTIGDKYVVEAVVGEGGFAVVYRAIHKVWRRPVAIKCFKGLAETGTEARKRLEEDFIREGALLSELSARSVSIVQARDVGTLTTRDGAWVPYTVLEWLEGETLEDLWNRDTHRWSLAEAMKVLEPVADALELAHGLNISHRDVKPANIFVIGSVGSDSMAVKLLDFGIAKVVQNAADQGLTSTGAHVTSFTPSYGAPEQFSRSKGATGPWTDVYALALILTELVTGKPALEGEDFIQLGVSTADPARRPTPRALGVDLGDDVEAVFERAVAIRPQDRFASAGALWNALRVAADASGRPSGERTTGRRSDPFGRAATEPLERSSARARTTEPQRLSATAPARRSSSVLALVPLVVILSGLLIARAVHVRSPAPVASTTSVAPATSSAPPPAPVCARGMAAIPGGRFFMGSDAADTDDDERPAHPVVLSPYCMDLEEVTVADYKACSDRGACKRASLEVAWPGISATERSSYSLACTLRDPIALARHPINCVDWDMARSYCAEQGRRLPTEAEWELAARGPDGRIYPWGDEPPDPTRLNACDSECVSWGKRAGAVLAAMYAGSDGFALTAPVGSFPKGASRYGLLDVVGNVWEWTSDWNGPYVKDGPPQRDPKGPERGTERVIRGGAWNGSFAAWVRPSQRYRFAPEAKTHAIGFRCASTQPGPG
ncbi:MAG: SUMF1/EgtB/PvdO family nonheme iron enzyme [Deltaproteobacteria bacterium]|nr:SUMF1/EgtB/PvdO family nonheme iron enzyme [Deltaproteobacteria bacterium]